MNPTWQNHLQNHGGHFDHDNHIYFSSNTDETKAALGSMLAILDHLAVIKVSGDDSESFLQGQLSNDLRLISPSHAQLSAWCSPKGRVITQLIVIRTEDGYFLLIPRELAETVLKRLRLFVLRSKVTIQDHTDQYACLGLFGSSAVDNIQRLNTTALPTQDYDMTSVASLPGSYLLRLPGVQPRYLLLATINQLIQHWDTISQGLIITGPSPWQWLDIQAGLPWISPANSDEYVPHMLNLDRLGAVSFTKGCYPGQEIVARTQYLGKVKRRLQLFHCKDRVTSPIGQEIYTTEAETHAIGKVIAAQPAPRGGTDLLAVVQLDAVPSATFRLGQPTGPVVLHQPLPYSLEDDTTPPIAKA